MWRIWALFVIIGGLTLGCFSASGGIILDECEQLLEDCYTCHGSCREIDYIVLCEDSYEQCIEDNIGEDWYCER